MTMRHSAGINQNSADNLAQRILTGDIEIVPLGLTTASLRRSSRNPGEVVRGRVSEALSGANRKIANACLAHARTIPGSMSTVLLDIMAHGRCDAAAWLALLPGVEWIDLPGDMGGRSVISRDGLNAPGLMPVFDTHVNLGDGVTWLGGGLIDLSLPRQSLPATVMEAAPGRPLRELLSHPALDPHGMTVRVVVESDGCIEIIADHPDGPWNEVSVPFADITPAILHRPERRS